MYTITELCSMMDHVIELRQTITNFVAGFKEFGPEKQKQMAKELASMYDEYFKYSCVSLEETLSFYNELSDEDSQQKFNLSEDIIECLKYHANHLTESSILLSKLEIECNENNPFPWLDYFQNYMQQFVVAINLIYFPDLDLKLVNSYLSNVATRSSHDFEFRCDLHDGLINQIKLMQLDWDSYHQFDDSCADISARQFEIMKLLVHKNMVGSQEASKLIVNVTMQAVNTFLQEGEGELLSSCLNFVLTDSNMLNVLGLASLYYICLNLKHYYDYENTVKIFTQFAKPPLEQLSVEEYGIRLRLAYSLVLDLHKANRHDDIARVISLINVEPSHTDTHKKGLYNDYKNYFIRFVPLEKYAVTTSVKISNKVFAALQAHQDKRAENIYAEADDKILDLFYSILEDKTGLQIELSNCSFCMLRFNSIEAYNTAKTALNHQDIPSGWFMDKTSIFRIPRQFMNKVICALEELDTDSDYDNENYPYHFELNGS